ncbi:TPA: hypothetical protein ACHVGK_002064, partial [Streptococcus suis]
LPNLILQSSIIILGLCIELYLLLTLKNIKTHLFYITFAILCILNYFLFKNIGTFQLTTLLFVSFPIGIYLSTHLFNRKLVATYSILLASFVIARTVIHYGEYQFFPNMSRNYISIFLLLCLFLWQISKSSSVPVLPSLIVFMGSILAIGRGGILMSGFLLVSYTMLKLNRMGPTKKILSLLALGFLIYFISQNIEVINLTLFNRFVASDASIVNSNSERLLIIYTYFRFLSSSIKYFVFGVPMRFIYGLGVAHTHNTFLQIHSLMGLFPFSLIVIQLIRRIVAFSTSKNYTMLILLSGIILRGMTDIFFPGELFDVLIIYFLFTGWEQNSLEIIKNKEA